MVKTRVRFTKEGVITGTLVLVLVLIGVFTAKSFVSEFFWGAGTFHGSHNDFLAFYGAAHLTLHGHIAQVYDATVLTAFQRTIVPHAVGASGYMPFMNPPFFALFLAPLALVSINIARLIWLVISIVLAGCIATHLVMSIKSRHWRWLLIGLLITSFPVYQNLIEGQVSLLLLAGGLAAMHYAQNKQPRKTGMFLAVAILKPQLAVFVGLVLLLQRQWRTLGAMVATSVAIVIASLPLTGTKIYIDYIQYLRSVTGSHLDGAGAVAHSVWQGTLQFSTGLNGLFTSLFGQQQVRLVNSFTVVCGLVLVVLYLWATNKFVLGSNKRQSHLWLIATISMMILLDVHAYAQDVVLLFLMIPSLIALRPKPTTVLGFLVAIQLTIIDQKWPIHLLTMVLVGGTMFVLIRLRKIVDAR